MIRFADEPIPPLSENDVHEAIRLVLDGGGVIIGQYASPFQDALFDLSGLGKTATVKDIAKATTIGMESIGYNP